MKKTGLNGYIYDFSIDYDATAADYILDIHKCLMRRNDTFGFIKKHFFTGLWFLLTLTSVNSLSAAPLSCILMNNQECKVRP